MAVAKNTKNVAAPKKSVAKPAPKKDVKKVYHVAKRASDGKWSIKFAGGEKSIKLYNTKEEAMAAADKMATNQGGVVLAHASKGAHAGKIQKKK